MKKIVLLLVSAALLAGLVLGAQILTKKDADVPVENAGTAQHAVVKPKTLTYEGQEYPMKENLQTVLLIGTDSVDPYDEETAGYGVKYNWNQADFMVLLVLDTDGNKAQLIQLNRDTITPVPQRDMLGRYTETTDMHLALSFNYGDGGAMSCKNTVQAASMLLFDAPIDHYIQIPMSAIGVLNDLVGGVPVTIQEDLTAADPAFTEGSTIHLTGAQAERFVRARMELENDTNLARMARQRQYMDSFQAQARKAINTDSNFVMKLLEKLSAYLQSDMTAQQLSELVTRLDQGEIAPIRAAEGELKLGEEYYEFYVDKASLWELVRAAYCGE